MKPRIDVAELKRRVSLVQLFERDGHRLQKSGFRLVCLCPFHSEQTPSCSIDPAQNTFHCFGCRAGGSVVDYAMRRFHCGFKDAIERLATEAGLAGAQAGDRMRLPAVPTRTGQQANRPAPTPPRLDGFGPGTQDQLRRLQTLRGIGLLGLRWAQARKLLVFGTWHGLECYGFTDKSQRLHELRRLDGRPFQALPHYGLRERKSHAIRGSLKSWPLGILEAQSYSHVALVEGGPDLLAAHHLVLTEQASHFTLQDVRCAPVAMMSASVDICQEALPLFAGKAIRIFPHADANGAGLIGAERWHQQLLAAGAKSVDFFDLTRVQKLASSIKDLNDFLKIEGTDLFAHHPHLSKVMPDIPYDRHPQLQSLPGNDCVPNGWRN